MKEEEEEEEEDGNNSVSDTFDRFHFLSIFSCHRARNEAEKEKEIGLKATLPGQECQSLEATGQ